MVDGVSCLCAYIVACCFGLIGLLTVRGCCRLRLVCCDCLCFLVFARLFVLGVCDGAFAGGCHLVVTCWFEPVLVGLILVC